MSEEQRHQVEAFLLAEEMLNLTEKFVEEEKFHTFAALKREFEEQELLTELNQENDITIDQSYLTFRSTCN